MNFLYLQVFFLSLFFHAKGQLACLAGLYSKLGINQKCPLPNCQPIFDVCQNGETGNACITRLATQMTATKTAVDTLVTCVSNLKTKMQNDLQSYMVQVGGTPTEANFITLASSLINVEVANIYLIQTQDLVNQALTAFQAFPTNTVSFISDVVSQFQVTNLQAQAQVQPAHAIINANVQQAYTFLASQSLSIPITSPQTCSLNNDLANVPRTRYYFYL